jgi:hypothetical protein
LVSSHRADTAQHVPFAHKSKFKYSFKSVMFTFLSNSVFIVSCYNKTKKVHQVLTRSKFKYSFKSVMFTFLRNSVFIVSCYNKTKKVHQVLTRSKYKYSFKASKINTNM